MNELLAIVQETGQRVLLADDGTWRAEQMRSAEPGGYDFRRSSWGASAQEIIASEGRDPDATQNGVLAYECSIAGLSALALFTTVGNKLVRAKYSIIEEHSDDQRYFADYESLGGLLEKKYGKPDQDEQHWINDLYRDEPSEWAMAVSAGHLGLFRQWKSERTETTLALVGDNYEVHLAIEYSSNELGHLEVLANEQAALDDL